MHALDGRCHRRVVRIALAFVTAATVTVAEARGHERDDPTQPEYRVWITGASNIRRFTCRAGLVSGSLALRAIPTRASVLSGENRSMQSSVAIAVDRIDCGAGAMNRHLRETLRSAAHPVIEFQLRTYEVDLSVPSPVARVIGHVTVAGVQRPVVVKASVIADSLGALHIRGEHVIRMSDFAVRAPRRFGGLLRVRDRITVHFDVAPAGCSAVDDIRRTLTPLADFEPGASYVSPF